MPRCVCIPTKPWAQEKLGFRVVTSLGFSSQRAFRHSSPSRGTKMPSAQPPAAGPHVSISTVWPGALVSKLRVVRGRCLEKGLMAKEIV